jgi:hypothetical protein
MISLLVLGAGVSQAATFNPTPYLAEAGVDVMTRRVANEQFDRDLLGAPYATVVVGHVDVYDRFPYLEARYFQVVSDPAWNRVLMGEIGRGVSAYDGSGGAFGKMRAPRGLSTDGRGRIFVADTGNDRVLVLRLLNEFDRVTLDPVFAIDGLAKPYGVAFSDGGTPLDTRDDRLYVANTGRNEVRRYDLDDRGARLAHTVGELGSGDGRFAGPMAITVGRRDGVHDDDVYVADAHNGRIVRLHDSGSAMQWQGAFAHDLGLVTSLDTDQFGNVYAAAPQRGSVLKLTTELEPLASYVTDIERPRSFHVVFADVRDHRAGTERVSGHGTGVLVEEWNGQHGLRMLDLGVELGRATADGSGEASVTVNLTDHAAVTAELVDPVDGRTIARHEAGVLGAGRRTVRFLPADFLSAWSAGEYRVAVHARSTYAHGSESSVELPITLATGGSPALPDRLTLLGNAPNPFNPVTTIRFVVPAGPRRDYNVRVYDVAGRLVRDLAKGQIDAGLREVRWDGTDDRGAPASSGVYLYRIAVGRETLHGKMVMLK